MSAALLLAHGWRRDEDLGRPTRYWWPPQPYVGVAYTTSEALRILRRSLRERERNAGVRARGSNG